MPAEIFIKPRSGPPVDECVTVREAAEELSRRTGKSLYEAMYELMLEVKRGKYAVESGAGTFGEYLLGPGGTWLWTVLALAAAAALLALFAESPPLIYLRYVLGALFVLYLPGYAIIEALYPKAGELTPLERLALSIGLSLAVVPLVGLALNYTPFGIRLQPVVISLAALTAGTSIAAAYRKYRVERLGSICTKA